MTYHVLIFLYFCLIVARKRFSDYSDRSGLTADNLCHPISYYADIEIYGLTICKGIVAYRGACMVPIRPAKIEAEHLLRKVLPHTCTVVKIATVQVCGSIFCSNYSTVSWSWVLICESRAHSGSDRIRDSGRGSKYRGMGMNKIVDLLGMWIHRK